MTDTHESDSIDSTPEGIAPAKWPRVLGIVGMIVGAFMIYDQVDDLLFYFTFDLPDWEEMFGPELASFIHDSLPGPGWMVAEALGATVLGALLAAASIALRKRRPRGARWSRLWAKLSIVWVLVCSIWGVWWIYPYIATSHPSVPFWRESMAFGVLIAALVLLAYPLFLLSWLRRPDVIREIESWKG